MPSGVVRGFRAYWVYVKRNYNLAWWLLGELFKLPTSATEKYYWDGQESWNVSKVKFSFKK